MRHVPHVEIEVDKTGRRARIVVDGVDWTDAVTSITVESAVNRMTTVEMRFTADVGTLDSQAAHQHRLAEVLRIRDELAGAPPVKRARIWAERSLLWTLARIR